jgi:hypothetical protein
MQKSTLRTIFLMGWLLVSIFSAQAQDKEDPILYRFADNWMRYDAYYQAFLPAQEAELLSVQSVHQLLRAEQYAGYTLSFVAEEGLVLFIDKKLFYKKLSKGRDTITIPVLKILEQAAEEEVLFTFYHEKGKLPLQSTFIKNEQASLLMKDENDKYLLFSRAGEINALQPYFILFLMIITLVIVFRQLYPKEFDRYFSFAVPEPSTEHLLGGPFSVSSLWMMVVNGLCLSLIIYLLKVNEVIFSASLPLVYGILIIMGAYGAFYLMKYIYLNLIAWVFNYSKVVNAHFGEYFRVLERLGLMLVLVVMGLASSGFVRLSVKPEVLYYSLIIILILAIAKVILLFFRLISHRNLYLFSYICATEMLPLIIAVKILLF